MAGTAVVEREEGVSWPLFGRVLLQCYCYCQEGGEGGQAEARDISWTYDLCILGIIPGISAYTSWRCWFAQ